MTVGVVQNEEMASGEMISGTDNATGRSRLHHTKTEQEKNDTDPRNTETSNKKMEKDDEEEIGVKEEEDDLDDFFSSLE